ncbi:MAG: hypothetical protein WBM08_05350 [Prochlorococcaceae cyanobacterium]
MYRNSLLSDLISKVMGHGGTEMGRVFRDDSYKPQHKAAYIAGRVANSFAADGERVPIWLLNYPLAQTSVQGEIASTAAGLAPDYYNLRREIAARKGVPIDVVNREEVDRNWAAREGWHHAGNPREASAPMGLPGGLVRNIIPLLASTTVVGTSSNHDLLNLAGGGRAKGYEAVLADPNDPTRTTNPIGEIALRYFAGRSGRLLPWEQFTEERPDVSPSDYGAARAHQFDKGPGGVGLFKSTGRNLDGEPEFTMLGFRVPLTAAASAGGGMVGAVAGARTLEKLIGEKMNQRLVERITANTTATHTPARFEGVGTFSMERPGMRKLVGALGGGLVGAVSGNLSSRAVNDLVIQPTFYPERVAAEQIWQQQQARKAQLAQQVRNISTPPPPPPPQQLQP